MQNWNVSMKINVSFVLGVDRKFCPSGALLKLCDTKRVILGMHFSIPTNSHVYECSFYLWVCEDLRLEKSAMEGEKPILMVTVWHQ